MTNQNAVQALPMVSRNRATFTALAALLLSSQVATADSPPSLDLRHFSPSPDPNSLLFLEPTSTPGAWNFNAAAWFTFAHRPLVVRNNDEITARLVTNQLSVDTTLNIGLGSRAALGLVVPAAIVQGTEDNAVSRRVLGGGTISEHALGDLALVGKATLLQPGTMGGASLAVVSRLTLPTGDTASTLGEGAVTADARLLGEMRYVSLSFLGTVGFKIRGERETLGNKTWGDEIPWGVGVSMKPQMFGIEKSGKLILGLEFYGSLPAGPDAPFTSAPQSPVFSALSARYLLPRDFSAVAGVEGGLGSGAGVAPVRATLGLGWAPRVHDRDHDGVPDDRDQCEYLPEDKDGFEDSDGCPELDNDDDGVLDPDDRCPTEKEDQDDFEDEDGCPDPDNDKDGVPDELDACPNSPGPTSPDPKKNGCVDNDPDHDGILGDKDKCPNDPEDKDGFQDADGCPDPDNDKDGIPDKEDACPNRAGPRDSIAARSGCPSPDTDGDAIENKLDKCPDHGETYNGVEDEDGCPEADKPGVKPLVEVVEKKGVTSLVLQRAPQFEKVVPPKTPAPPAQPTPPAQPAPPAPTPNPTPAPNPTPPLPGKPGPKIPPVRPSPPPNDAPQLTTEGKATVRAISQVLLAHKTWGVRVAVRPLPNEDDKVTTGKAKRIADAIHRSTHRPGAATVVPWQKGKMGIQAEVHGVSIELILDAPPELDGERPPKHVTVPPKNDSKKPDSKPGETKGEEAQKPESKAGEPKAADPKKEPKSEPKSESTGEPKSAEPKNIEPHETDGDQQP